MPNLTATPVRKRGTVPLAPVARTGTECVDFLIVTALKTEYDAVLKLLDADPSDGQDTIATIPRQYAPRAFYRINVIRTGQNNTKARAAVQEALRRVRARAVILTGIAAGFPESGVRYGDLLIPHWVIPYEHGRDSGLRSVSTKRGNLQTTFEFRDDPVPVSETLWKAAQKLSFDDSHPWQARMSEKRPDQLPDEPPQSDDSAIHIEHRYKIASGDKLLAGSRVPIRGTLLKRYRKTILGAEMEGFGCITASRDEERPFLLVKAVQDYGLDDKNNQKRKRRWRKYAATLAAAFVVTLIERFVFREDELSVAATSCITPLESWHDPRVDLLISSAKESIEVVDSYFDEATYLAPLVGRALSKAKGPLAVTVRMVDPIVPFGPQRYLERLEYTERSGKTWEEFSRQYQEDFQTYCTAIRAGFNNNRQLRDALRNGHLVLEIYKYRTMPQIRLIVVDKSNVVFGWYPLADTNPNFPCFMLLSSSPVSIDQAVVERITVQLAEIHRESSKLTD